MAKFTLLVILLLIAFLPTDSIGQSELQSKRCGTMEAIENRIKTDPAYKAAYEKGLLEYQASKNFTPSSTNTLRTNDITSPVTIPVIVHIVLPNPHIVTDADVDYFINRLNLDFSGLNPDSANAAAFYPIRGHSFIRFARARRDPNGNFTSGIERRVGSGEFFGGNPEPIKKASTGGLDPWDHTQYYNLWVGANSGGVLGVAPAIGVGTAATDGVVVSYKAFANNSCYSDPQFNLARTAVHEIGHNFGLYHIFDGGCSTQNDFGQLSPGSCSLPPGLLAPADDTPGQSNSTSGCPSGVQSAGCGTSPNPPGKNYQNFMDYTADACYSMFTKGQVNRMHYVLETCRPGYLTTQGHLPPANMQVLDASILEAVNPGGGSEVVGCVSTKHVDLTCPGSLVPKARIINRGSATITSLIVGFQLNNNTPVENTLSVNIATGNTMVVSFPNVVIPSGIHTLKFWTKSPNGSVDMVKGNDTLTLNLNAGVGTTLPFAENFSSTTFPPLGWSLVHVAGSTSSAAWMRSTATATGAPGSALANLYLIEEDNKIDIRTPLISIQGNDSIFVAFEVAHQQYNNIQDTLQLLASADCGNTFVKLWESWSSQLSTTNPPTGNTEFIPSTNQWRSVNVALPTASQPGILNHSDLLFAWRAVSKYGNNIFVDNINITGRPTQLRDIQPTRFTSPALRLCDGANVKPVVTVRNNGSSTINSFLLSYQVNGGTVSAINWSGSMVKDSSVSVELNVANYPIGTYTIKAWTSAPNNTTDLLLTNDTITYTFKVEAVTAAPLVEGFESTTFPPASWDINQQPVDDTTWQRTTAAGRNSMASAFINNFIYKRKGSIDDLLSPVVSYSGADSVFLKFDVAAATKNYPGSTTIPLDTLEVLVSLDCGLNFTSVYKKWGYQLQTINDPNNPYLVPFTPVLNSQWRRDSINLTGLLGSSNTVRFAFRSTNHNENNIYLDNINFTPKVLSDRLKSNGFMITPSPFRNDFVIQHYLPPTSLMGFGLYNAIGQLVVVRNFSAGTADSYIQVNMSHLPAGVYTIKLLYNDRSVSQKIVKVN